MNKTISIAKGFGILLMVLGHAGCPDGVRSYIYVFHMPLFFFLSGYCFNDKYLSSPKTFVLRKIKGLYLPYVKYALLFLLLHNLFLNLNVYNEEYDTMGAFPKVYLLKDFAVRVFNIITRMTGCEQLLGGFWFLKQLLLASIVGFFIIRFSRNIKYKGGILLIIAFLLKWSGLSIPFWDIGWLSFLAAAYFVVGYDFSRWEIKYSSFIMIITFGLVITICSFLYDAEMEHNTLHSLFPCFFAAVLGCISMFFLSNIIASKSKVLTTALFYIGNHSLSILVWSFLCFKLVSWVIILIYDLPIAQLAEFPVIRTYALKGWWIVYTIVGCVCPLLLNRIEDFFYWACKKMLKKSSV